MKYGLLSILFIIISSSLLGCGKLRDTRLGNAVGDFGGIGSIEEPPQRNLNQNELQIAQRVCLSLKSKRLSLEASPGAIAYYFNLEQRDCRNKIVGTEQFIANIVLLGTELEYSVSGVSNYFVDVVTDKTQSITQLCESVLDLSTVLNTKKISNTTALLDKLYTVQFSVSDNSYDTLQVTTRIKNANGSYMPFNSAEIKIATNETQLGAKFIGVEKERSHYIACNGLEFSTVKETWLNAVTPIP